LHLEGPDVRRTTNHLIIGQTHLRPTPLLCIACSTAAALTSVAGRMVGGKPSQSPIVRHC
jgi:hypothetical protein